jgi:ABC-type nitrate/sulfonate/bicarbonate transport system permease component
LAIVIRQCRALAGIGMLLAAWWLLPSPTGAVPPLPDVLEQGWSLVLSGMIFVDMRLSLWRVGTGAIIGVLAALVAGVACIIPMVRDMISGPLELARPIPPIAWIPLALVLFGVGDPSAIALVALAVFFPVMLSIVLALDSIDGDLVLAARSLGARPPELVRHVYVPAMAPIVLTGVRLGVGIGWFSVVAAEMVGSHRGLGYGIQIASLNLEMERFFVYLAVIGICGFVMNAALLWIHDRVNAWQGNAGHVE